jgi:transposase-like protein
MPEVNLVALAARYADEDAARNTLERLRWPNGPVCPKCAGVEPYRITPKPGSKTRKGLWKCKACRKQFTVTVGTIFEDSHIPLGKWLMAIHLMCASKKGMSAHQLHRMLGVTYKSSWFMCHRIRYAMGRPPLVDKLKGIVEADETYVGGIPKNRHLGKREPAPPKSAVLSLVERKGKVRSFHVPDVTGENLKGAIRRHVDPKAKIMTDGHASYAGLGREFAGHEAVDHADGTYVKGAAHVNTAENYFSILKRGIIGVYHHVSTHHLGRYLDEFDFRYNARDVTDKARADAAVKAADGKRLTYKPLIRRALA